MFISEEDKEEILGKYKENVSVDVLNYLKRRFPVFKQVLFSQNPVSVPMISVESKSFFMEGNKSYLVNRLSAIVSEDFPNESEKTIRRTIKFYLDFWKKFV